MCDDGGVAQGFNDSAQSERSAIGWILRDAGYDVSHTVFWLPPMTGTPS